MKYNRYALAFVAVLAAFQICAQAWKDEARRLVDIGEFERATALIKALPAVEREREAFQVDSLQRVMARMRRDFSMTPAKGVAELSRLYGRKVTMAEVERWKQKNYVESMTIDGQQWWFRRGIRNFSLLNREDFCAGIERDRHATYLKYEQYGNDALATKPDRNGVRDWRKADITMTIDVDADVVPEGETLRVWMPYPYKCARQRNIRLVSSSAPVTMSEGSIHHTAYMEAKAVRGRKTHFEINYTYEVGEWHISQAEMLKRLRPYNKESVDYLRYTASEYPHRVITPRLAAIARDVVGRETNPVLQASKVYDWIATCYKWAGAREYSTIASIPDYVIDHGHGDCGQVALLYITLMRSLGVPVRWQSGWMLHPGSVNLHDWTETYFEGVGWVPTDPSFGRSTRTEACEDYYKSGLDLYRMAANEGICGAFSPAKQHVRCETVDSQAGEVEWAGGNLEYGQWHYDLTVNSIEKL